MSTGIKESSRNSQGVPSQPGSIRSAAVLRGNHIRFHFDLECLRRRKQTTFHGRCRSGVIFERTQLEWTLEVEVSFRELHCAKGPRGLNWKLSGTLRCSKVRKNLSNYLSGIITIPPSLLFLATNEFSLPNRNQNVYLVSICRRYMYSSERFALQRSFENV